MTSLPNPIHVLVVDDDDIQRRLTLDYLSRLGIGNCLEAQDGAEALDLLHHSSKRFDVVFTDNQMPVMDGPDLIINIRDDARFAHLKLVMISGNLSANPLKTAAETALRIFLTEHDVLPVPKDGLNSTVLKEALQQVGL